jgi:hypothetical protein
MISRIEESSPPGVFRTRMIKRAFSFSALSIVLTMYSEEIGCMGASTVILKIEAFALRAKEEMTNRSRSVFFTLLLL